MALGCGIQPVRSPGIGGHLVLLGLKEAHPIWAESPYTVLEWARRQQAVCGFAHLEYLNNKIQNELNCCIPIDYPVEAALGNIDFVSEDVLGERSFPAGLLPVAELRLPPGSGSRDGLSLQ